MKIKHLLTKTLLVAAGLLLGGANSVWAETFSGSVSFTAQNRITNNGNGTFTTASNAGNQYALALADLSGLEHIASATSVTLEFDVTIQGRLHIGIGDKNTRGTNANGSSKSSYNTDGLVMRYGTTDGTYVRVNGGTNNSNLLNNSSHVRFTLDRTTGKYSYTITYVDGESVVQTGLSASNQSTSVSNATIVEAYTWLSSNTITISDVSYSYEYTASSFDYTVKAVDSESNVLSTLASGTSTEAVTVSYPRAIKVGEVWYTCPSTNNFSVEATSLNANPTITYTPDKSIIYFKEAENITGSQHISSASCSGGVYVDYYGGPTSVTIPVSGTYELETNVASRNTKSSLEVFPADGTTSVSAIAKSGALGIRTCQFTADAGTMRVGGPYYDGKFQNSLGFDYVLIRLKSIPVTIPSSGLATISSAYPLNCAALPSGLKAYKVSEISATSATLVQVTEAVAAGTGLILEGTAGPYDIPVVASGTDISATNKLHAAVTATTLADGSFYVLKGGEFLLVTGTADEAKRTVPAGKAYLLASDMPAPAPELSIVFEGEATGISEIKTMRNAGNEIFFDLQGRKVAQPAKGLYIVNGKKVVIK